MDNLPNFIQSYKIVSQKNGDKMYIFDIKQDTESQELAHKGLNKFYYFFVHEKFPNG